MSDDLREAVATLHPGELIEGKYRVKRLLQQGGMGAVYHAVQEPLGRDVAIKVLKPLDETPEKRGQRYKRFFREAQVSSRLAHPNTIVILDYGELHDREGFFFVMEYLDGLSLRQLLANRGVLGTRLTLHVAMQIASSLADAHAHSVIHRDLKPPNVMLVRRADDPYFVKVVDFGLVKEIAPDREDDELTAENALIGSPTYMAPERFLHVDSDAPAVDVYALGIIMYEMLVGRPPFVRDSDSTLHHIMLQHVQSDPPPMRSLHPDIDLPAGLETLIMRCLEKDPRDRIGSMDALLQLLRSCAASVGMGVAAPVDDTGTFAPGARPRLESSSDALRVESTGDSQFETVEDAVRPVPGPDPAPIIAPTLEAESQSSSHLWKGAAAFMALVLIVVGGLALSRTVEDAPTTLVVDSVPPGATVFMGQKAIGVTPFDVPLELQGPESLRFTLDGYDDHSAPISPDPGARVEVRPALVAQQVEVAPPVEVEPVEVDEAADGDEAVDVAVEQPAPPVDKKPQSRRKRPRQNKKSGDLDIKLDR